MDNENKRLIDLTWLDIKPLLKRLIIETEKENHLEPQKLKEILSLSEASELLSLSKPTIYNLTSKKLIPFYKKGKKLYFKASDLLTWISEGKRKSISELEKEANEFPKIRTLKHK